MTAILRSFEEQVQPEHTALLVIDMQNDFCAEGGYLNRVRNYDVAFAAPVATNIASVIGAARKAGVPVVWIRSHYDFKYLAAPDIAKRGQEGLCLEGSWGADFFRLAPEADDLIVDKHHFSGFKGTRLDGLLRSRDIRTLVVTGVATNVCVDSTLREGFFLGYYIVLLEDCVGSNSKAGHEGTLATVCNNIGTVAMSAVLIEVLKGP